MTLFRIWARFKNRPGALQSMHPGKAPKRKRKTRFGGKSIQNPNKTLENRQKIPRTLWKPPETHGKFIRLLVSHGHLSFLQEMLAAGQTKSLAVSNFSPEQLDCILANPATWMKGLLSLFLLLALPSTLLSRCMGLPPFFPGCDQASG